MGEEWAAVAEWTVEPLIRGWEQALNSEMRSSVVDAVCDIKHYKFQVESPTSKPRDKTST